MPDGLQDLTDHNLITFKSFRESLDDWALKELTGHYVNYRKQEVDEAGLMLVEKHFSLFAISARYPRELFKVVRFKQINEGVYDCQRGSDRIRVIVANQLSETEHNSLLHLFSAVRDRVEYGSRHHQMKHTETSTIVNQVFSLYRQEGSGMPYTIEDFNREIEPYYKSKFLNETPPKELIHELFQRYSSQHLLELINEEAKQKASIKTKTRKKRKPR